MVNLVTLVNGTWNDDTTIEDWFDLFKRKSEDELTNIHWLRQICEDDEGQKVNYLDGVGTHGLVDKAVGGAFGLGLKRDIQKAYLFCAQNYTPGDRLFFFGFSRGAYTVRTAADMIATVGLANLKGITGDPAEAVMDRLYDLYRKKSDTSSVEDLTFHNAASASEAPGTTEIHFVGVWDTVGTAGIPDQYGILDSFDEVSRDHHWANTQISPVIMNARHAIGMDEWRESFVPAVWTDADGNMLNTDKVKQLWFSGAHTDVGGGYKDRQLGDVAMRWMVQEADDLDLNIDASKARPISNAVDLDYGPVNNSNKSIFKKMWSRPRGVPNLSDPNNKKLFHPSVCNRFLENPDDFAAFNLAHKIEDVPEWRSSPLEVGQSLEFEALASKRWNKVGVFVEPDAGYEITAQGRWRDGHLTYGPDGVREPADDDQWFSGKTSHAAADGVAALARRVRADQAYRRFPLSWRDPEYTGFALVGVVADGRGVIRVDEVTYPEPHTSFEIGNAVQVGAGTDHRVKRSGGYLYCYVNDVWNRHDNNSGTMKVTVRRIG